MDIGKKIKLRRKELNMSADDLAQCVGKDRSTIFRYENGDIDNMSIALLQPIAEALDVSVGYLLGLEENKNSAITNDIVKKSQLGTKIKKARKAKGLTQDDLGNMLGLKKSAIAKYECGRVVNLKQETIKKLCDILDLSPDDLILDHDDTLKKEDEEKTTPQGDVLDVILRLHQDSEFFNLVKKLSTLDNKQFIAVQKMIEAFID